MSTEASPKRESPTGWIIAVVVLLLLAAGIPLAVKTFGPREFTVKVQGDPGGKIVWRSEADGKQATGMTNLPATLIFHAQNLEFTVRRTNYTGPMQLDVQINGSFNSSASTSGGSTLVGFRFFRFRSGAGVSEGITGVP